MESARRCIVSVGVGGNYGAVGIPRLSESLVDVGDTAFKLFYKDAYPEGSPTNALMPRAFKMYAMKAAIDAGNNVLMWNDATVCWEHSTEQVWERIEKDGYFFTQWSNKITDIGNHEAFSVLGENWDVCNSQEIPTILAGLWGVDLRTDIGRAIYEHLWMTMSLGAWMEPDGREEVPMSLMVKRWGLKSDADHETNWFTARHIRNPNRLAWFQGV